MDNSHWKSILHDVAEVTLYDEKGNTIWFGGDTVKSYISKNEKEGKYYIFLETIALDSGMLGLLSHEKIQDKYFFKNGFNTSKDKSYVIKLRTIGYDLESNGVSRDFHVIARKAFLNQSIELPLGIDKPLTPTLTFCLEDDEHGFAFNIEAVDGKS